MLVPDSSILSLVVDYRIPKASTRATIFIDTESGDVLGKTDFPVEAYISKKFWE